MRNLIISLIIVFVMGVILLSIVIKKQSSLDRNYLGEFKSNTKLVKHSHAMVVTDAEHCASIGK